MNTKRLTAYDSDTSIGLPASEPSSQSSLVVHQYTESPRLGRRGRASVAAIPGTPPQQPAAPLVEVPNGSPAAERPSPPIPRRVAPPPPRRASVPALSMAPQNGQASPKPKPKLSPLQQRLHTKPHPPTVPESNSALSDNSDEHGKEDIPLGPESLSISLDTSIGISEGDLASDIFAALASKGLDL